MADRLEWKGEQVKRRMEQSIIGAFNETMVNCVTVAKSDHRGWQNRTGTAEGSIQMRPAKKVGSFILGLWGSFDVNYVIFLEIHHGSFLRRAADLIYPLIVGRINARFMRK